MMTQARGSAVIAVATALLLLLCSDIARATTYKVGDDHGWGFGVSDWAKGKSFKAGDILEFNYDPLKHNVWQVDDLGYDACTVPCGATGFQSGHDKIKLENGTQFFICSVPTHCSDHGMKLAICVE